MATNPSLRLEVAAAAELLLTMCNGSFLPVNVFTLASTQGIVAVKPRVMEESARIVGLRSFRIFYNPDHPQTRQRFSICHEIAHSFFVDEHLAQDAGLVVRVQTNAPLQAADEEALCNSAAGVLLMPRERFVSRVQDLQPTLSNLEVLASLFAVSKAAVLNRISALRLNWPCTILHWKPVPGHGAIAGFRLVDYRPIGQVRRSPFRLGSVVTLDGLYKTHHTGRLAVDERFGVRLESCAFNRGGQREIFSLLTASSS